MARDQRTIDLLVTWAPELAGNQVVETIKISGVNGALDIRTSNPVDYRFTINALDPELKDRLVFAAYEMRGRSAAGVYVDCADGFSSRFEDASQKVAILSVECSGSYYTLPYSIVLRDTQTDRLYLLDPGSSNDDKPGGVMP